MKARYNTAFYFFVRRQWCQSPKASEIGYSKAQLKRRLGTALPYIMWLSIFLAIGFSLRPTVPLVWNDSPEFIKSALLTLADGVPTTVGGRDIGYPAIIATIFALGGDLSHTVLLQQVLCCLMIVLVAWTAVQATGRYLPLIPVLLLAIYPGELIFRHLVLAECLYSVMLGLAGCLAVLSIQATGWRRAFGLAIAMLIAGIAVCLKSIGFFFFALMAAFALWAAIKRPWWYSGLVITSVIAASGLVAGNFYVRSSSPDPYSQVFVQKTLFCNHANIFLKSNAAREQAAFLLGENSGRFLARVSEDVSSKGRRWASTATPAYSIRNLIDSLETAIRKVSARPTYTGAFFCHQSATALLISFTRLFIRCGTAYSWPGHHLGVGNA